MKAFERYHPIVLFCYFFSVIGFTMLLQHPAFLLLSCLNAAWLSGILLNAKVLLKSLCFTLPLLFIIGLTNPLFSHNGLTVLFYINNIPITLESFVYGFAMGIMLVSIFYWFRSFQKLFSSEKVIYLFGRVSPAFALMLSMTLRMVPKAKRQAEKINNAQIALKGNNNNSIWKRLKASAEHFSVLITWMLENGVDTADSMRARGYGLKGRSQYHTYHFAKWDGLLLFVILLLSVMLMIGYFIENLTFTYYPLISHNENEMTMFYIICFCLLSALPIILEGKEVLQWRYLRSKM